MSNLKDIAKLLAQTPEVLLASHLTPDGDSIGSTIALGLALAERGQNVLMVAEDPVPGLYCFLDGADRFMPPEAVAHVPPLAVVLDCTEVERTGAGTAALIRKAEVVVNIDHHVSNEGFGDHRLVLPSAAATGELVYQLLKVMEYQLSSSVATALYTAIVMDTGCFQYSSTTARTHRVAADLLELGAAMEEAHLNLFQTKPLVGLRLLGKALDTLTLSENGRLAWMSVPYGMIAGLEASDEHIEGLINYPRSLKGVEIAILFKEIKPGEVKISFRSKTVADVNQLAGWFGGGGHVRAAGCSVAGTLSDVEAKVVTAASEYLKNLSIARQDCQK
jgi:phosphoesterase RecJ-like protein